MTRGIGWRGAGEGGSLLRVRHPNGNNKYSMHNRRKGKETGRVAVSFKGKETGPLPTTRNHIPRIKSQYPCHPPFAMIDFFAIITRGGIILFLYSPTYKSPAPLIHLLNTFVNAVVLDTTFQAETFTQDNLNIKWRMKGEVVFVCAWQRLLPIPYAEVLLERVERVFRYEGLEEVEFKEFGGILAQVEVEARKPSIPVKAISQGSKKGKEGKKQTTWDEKVSKAEMTALDFSKRTNQEAAVAASHGEIIPSGSLEEFKVDDSPTITNGTKNDAPHWISSMISAWTGNKELTSDDIAPTLSKMQTHLLEKNVALQAAEYICKRVEQRLLGKKTGAFTTMWGVVKGATEGAVKDLLDVKPTDLLLEIRASKRPYVITFVGVNGVGKSTNLSKVCYWLLNQGHSILIAACDTFRSGAVEQLRTHVKNLSALLTNARISLFERGYGKDASSIAEAAIAHARNEHYDVVMIDTAGRMQDNVPLMRALAKLVSVNQPNKLVFVGEALVGNEGVDQITKFNKALCDYSDNGSARRQIDGLLLTKFDAIDDKIGAALSMTFVSGAPILFVGTGQTYSDLKRITPGAIVETLLK